MGAWSCPFGALRVSRLEEAQSRKVGAEVSTVDGCKPVGLGHRVRRNDKIRDEVNPRASLASVPKEDLPCQVGGCG